MRRAVTIALLLVVLLAGCQTTGVAETETPTPTVEKRSGGTGTVDLTGLPIAQEFRITSPRGVIAFPVTVEFHRFELGNWTEAKAFRVSEGEPFEVWLTAGERYRIVVEGAEGERRMVGTFTPVKDGDELELVVGGCCVDDFGRAES